MKKSKLIISLLIAATSLSSMSAVAISCKNTNKKTNNNQNDEKKNPDEKPQNNQDSKGNDNKNNNSTDELSVEEQKTTEYKKIISEVSKLALNDPSQLFDLKFKAFSNQNSQDLLPSQIVRNFNQGVEFKQKKFNDEIEIKKIVNVLYVQTSTNSDDWSVANKTGQLNFNITIKDKKTNKTFIETITVGKFKTNPYGFDENGTIPNTGSDALRLNKSELEQYLEGNQTKRYELDNKKYLDILTRQQEQKSIKEIRPNLDASQSNIQKFDAKAKEISQDSYESAARKGFTLPSYDSNGNVEGLAINETPGGQGPSPTDAFGRDPYKITGLARTLPNEHYRDIASQTFGIRFLTPIEGEERKFTNTAGTTWIMDYQQRSDGKYPTKWYFATNLHVADALKQLTTSFTLLKLMDSAKIRTTLRLANLDENTYRFSFTGKDSTNVSKGIKTVYTARDFLNSKPSDYLIKSQKEKYKDVEEYADFAVFEVDFEKLTLQSVSKNDLSENSDITKNFSNLDAHELAKALTSNYAQNKEKQIKFLSKSYLSNYQKIDVPLKANKENKEWWKNYDELFALGYPNSTQDFFLRRYVDDDQIKRRDEFNYSLWTNSDYRFYDQLAVGENETPSFSQSKTERGNYLSYSLGYRTFIDKPGISDVFLAQPGGMKQVQEEKDGQKYQKSVFSFYESSDGKTYMRMGLNYMPKHFAPVGGASGTSLRNQKNELVGIFYLSNIGAKTGLAAAFRSEGFDYKGLYGNYNLPQYDLIYGGGKDQKNSFRQTLKELYKNNSDFKTALFPDGLGDDKVPNEFKFTENKK
ncbi:hypothetical protein LH651_02760 [Mycoplasma hominis]|uniref:Ig-specific serine endopeptidase MIP n=1 Tax=Metamycoplasma hominis TaxID=2098 RepID=UPI001F2DC79D|nr:hypothetical protein [Metamycoplasma hominis]MCF1355175.1 hypothetical protein [Metamycoplasma hominis]